MDPVEVTRWGAAICVIAASLMVAWGQPARLVMWGFVVFTVASALWIGAAAIEAKWALVVQNAVLFGVNVWGWVRWAARAREEG
ncbi:hypothetical protein [Jannaschia aquimarina]|uniref:Nicotinamide riboside transporter PnuC n=1 Tax=Jannaschia aquimarina TaxID=935700 RepID=A0A0D1EKI0_9RHOB|nr:hypothetical protein [Jannaschia aquimarina]KIT17531.1 hypothetical protein jaqu_07200 [Jannaschia aquimarina]SNS73591.1 hypothetical protein SAMN05421775_10289 [Jannaschia aquimarina]